MHESRARYIHAEKLFEGSQYHSQYSSTSVAVNCVMFLRTVRCSTIDLYRYK